MEIEHQNYKKLIEQQLLWCKRQDHILEELDTKFNEMKRIANFAIEHELTSVEVDIFNGQLNVLKNEVDFLEKQLNCVVP